MRRVLMLAALGVLAACHCHRRGGAGPSGVRALGDGPPVAPAPSPKPQTADIPKIDVHTHIEPGAIARTLALMDPWGINHAVNLSGGAPGAGLEIQLQAAQQAGGRISVFCNLDWRQARAPGYGARMAGSLVAAQQLGAIGLKIPKGLGLGFVGPKGKLLRVDDPELDVVWKRAGQLGFPVLIHIGDPKAFWQRPDEHNERFDELRAHPYWSQYGQPVPSWQALYDGFERLVGRHPQTTFIGAHFGNDPEDPDRVAQMLDKHPNFYIDTAARIPEIGRQDPQKMRAFFEKYQDRVLFGSDLGVGPEPGDLMLGSTDTAPPTPDDVHRFFSATWRYFETTDHQFDHPTPIQGRWKIDGVGLARPVLEKIYWRNAARLLGITLAPPTR